MDGCVSSHFGARSVPTNCLWERWALTILLMQGWMNERSGQGVLGTTITNDGSSEWLNHQHEQGIFGNESLPLFHPGETWNGFPSNSY